MKDLGFPKSCAGNLKQQLIRTTLRNIRSQGHPYVELREDGKTLIFFCTLCLAPCYSDSVLFDHLKGNLHSGRLAAAQVTLMKSNPWPFSDGVFFFHGNSYEQNKLLLLDSELVDTHHVDEENSAIASYNDQIRDKVFWDSNQENDSLCDELVIPSVLLKEEVSDLVVRHMGVGRIGARLSEKDGVSSQIHKIWCEWLGYGALTCDDSDKVIAEHDFALVIFPYNCSLGRMGVLGDFRYLLPSSSYSETEDTCSPKGKKMKSFSDQEDMNESSNLEGSSGEDSQSSNNSSSKTVLSTNDDQQVLSRIVSSKTMRKQMRNHQRVICERLCDICQQRMLPNKDVAALMNTKTGKLVCSSRNSTGAFHLFHVSCLIHWILVCEFEIYGKQPAGPKTKKRTRKNIKAKGGQQGKKNAIQTKPILSSFCPECQGTGITVDGEELEKPTISLSEIFKYKIKLCDARKAWMKNPEDLQNCSMGFSFPPTSDEAYKESTAYLKLLHFYRAAI